MVLVLSGQGLSFIVLVLGDGARPAGIEFANASAPQVGRCQKDSSKLVSGLASAAVRIGVGLCRLMTAPDGGRNAHAIGGSCDFVVEVPAAQSLLKFVCR
jgi:hypothetical protein